jgi:hypothetical protein
MKHFPYSVAERLTSQLSRTLPEVPFESLQR